MIERGIQLILFLIFFYFLLEHPEKFVEVIQTIVNLAHQIGNSLGGINLHTSTGASTTGS
jgi:hypothetical protein